MQVLFLVLNRTEYLETLLERLLESGIHGCTVLDSMGMMRVIDKSGDDLPMFGAPTVAEIESYLDGTEIAVTVLDEGDGPVALPAVEIRPESGVYDYESRYTAGATRFVTPPDLSDDVLAAAGELAVSVHRELGLRHLSRVDLIVEKSGRPVFFEGNVAPGMTETSLAPLAFEAAGRELGEVFAKLVDLARG